MPPRVCDSGNRLKSLAAGELAARRLHHCVANRHPSRFSGHQRHGVDATAATGFFHDRAKNLEDGVIAQALGAELRGRGTNSLTQRYVGASAAQQGAKKGTLETGLRTLREAARIGETVLV